MELNISESSFNKHNNKTDNFKKFLLKQEKTVLANLILGLVKSDQDITNFIQKIKKNPEINKSIELSLLEDKPNPNNNSQISLNKKEKSKSKASNLFNSKVMLSFKFLYFGENYDGLVVQQDTSNTIEEKILQAFLKCKLIENIKECNFSRCGRTDKGVSSFSNCFNIEVRKVENFDYVKVLNKLLPKDIRIISSSNTDLTFDSRFSCLFREYKYFFIRKNMNIQLMKEAASKLIGEHNFFNFCKIDKSKVDEDGNSVVNYNRRIYELSIHKYLTSQDDSSDYYSVYYFQIKGSAFLWHQIRCIMSILFLIGQEKEPLSLIDSLLKETSYHFNYSIADDYPLLLSNCEFEGVDFTVTEEAYNEIFFTLSEQYERKLIEYSLYKHMLTLFSSNKQTKDKTVCLNIDNFINQVKETNPEMKHTTKYTQILNRKRNIS